MTDSEILNYVLELQDSESEDSSLESEEKILIDNLISIMDSAIKGLEKWSFITEQELTSNVQYNGATYKCETSINEAESVNTNV